MPKNPRFSMSRTGIVCFFASSNEQLFFWQGRDAVKIIKELQQLSEQFRHCERGVA